MKNLFVRYIVNVDGTRTTVTTDQSITAEQLDETMQHARHYVVHLAYVVYYIADVYLTSFQAFLQQKRLYRFDVKRHFTACQDSLRATMRVLEKDIDRDYYDEYVMTIYEGTERYINKLFQLCTEKLANVGCKRPGLCAKAIVAENLVDLGGDTFASVMQAFKETRGVDLSKAFAPYCPTTAIKHVREMLISVMGEKDINRYKHHIMYNKEISRVYSEFYHTIYYDPKIRQLAEQSGIHEVESLKRIAQ